MSKQQAAGVNPTLIIGMGGTGKDIIMRVRRLIVEHYGSLENLPVVAFLSIDTDDAPAGVPERFLDQDISLKPEEKVVLDTDNIPPILGNLAQYDYLSGWFPPDLTGIQDLKSGAKQIRALGRLAFFLGYNAVKEAALGKVKSVTDRDKAKFMIDHYGMNVDQGVNVFLVSSLCGGTGSGMTLDMAYNLKHWFKYDNLLGEVNAMLMLPGAFSGVSDRIKANGYAALKELNHYQAMGRAESAHFRAQYTSNPLDKVDESGPPFTFCYLLGDQNKVVDSARITDLQEMVAQKIALEFTSNFARYAKSNRSNLEGVWQVTPRDPFGLPQNYLSFGLASVRFPVDRVRTALAARLGAEMVGSWLNVQGEHRGSKEQVETFLAKHRWVETAHKAPFYDFMMQAGGGGSLADLLEAWKGKVDEDLMAKTDRLKVKLTDVDAILWGHHKEMRGKTRGVGQDVQKWGEHARQVYDNMAKLRKQTEDELEKAITEAVDDPLRGTKHAQWLIGELCTTFETYREGYLQVGKVVAEDCPSEKDLNEFLGNFDPIAETVWKKVTGLAGKELRAKTDDFLELLERHHRIQLELKVREVGAAMFGHLIARLGELRGRVEKVEQMLGALRGELHALEKSVSAEILSLNYANTNYLFDGEDITLYYAERFAEPDSESKAFRQLTLELLKKRGGSLMALAGSAGGSGPHGGLGAGGSAPQSGLWEWASEREAFKAAILDAAAPLFSQGPQKFKLDETTVIERFFAKYPERKKQEAVLHNLYNHANPFIHVDGKQAAHKFTMTAIQKVVGLAGADSAHPVREVQEMLKVLHAACHLAPTHVKPNPDRHMLVFIQEFGAFPLRVVKGLEGYRGYYQHYLDQHLHITKTYKEFADLFPPDEAKLAEAQRGLTLGLALGVLTVDPEDKRTVVYHFKDKAGLPDTVELGAEEQAGISTLVAHDEARDRLLVTIENIGKGAKGPDAKRGLYDGLIRYARQMEASLGTRHPRYQTQKAILGEFIKTHLMEEGGAPAVPSAAPTAAPAAEAVVSPAAFAAAQGRYESLFTHFWVDKVIDAQERQVLEQTAATLGISGEQARAIETRVMGS